MASPLNPWDIRLQPWRYGAPPVAALKLPARPAIGIGLTVLLNGWQPAPAPDLGVAMAVTLDTV